MAALDPGTPFPSIALRDETGAPAASPNGETLYAVFKTTCPTCELAWPYLERIRRISDDSMKDGKAVGLSVVAIAQDDPTKSRAFADRPHSRFGLSVCRCFSWTRVRCETNAGMSLTADACRR